MAKPQTRPFMVSRPDKYRREQNGGKLSELSEDSSTPNLVQLNVNMLVIAEYNLFATFKMTPPVGLY